MSAVKSEEDTPKTARPATPYVSRSILKPTVPTKKTGDLGLELLTILSMTFLSSKDVRTAVFEVIGSCDRMKSALEEITERNEAERINYELLRIVLAQLRRCSTNVAQMISDVDERVTKVEDLIENEVKGKDLEIAQLRELVNNLTMDTEMGKNSSEQLTDTQNSMPEFDDDNDVKRVVEPKRRRRSFVARTADELLSTPGKIVRKLSHR